MSIKLPRHPSPDGVIPKDFPAYFPVQIRYADVDAMNHVNNAAYLTFLEVARTRLWHERVRPAEDARDFPFIVASASIQFKSPILLHDEVQVGVAVKRVGTRSFALDYEIRVGDRVAAEAETVQVYYDYASGRSLPIPGELRERLAALHREHIDSKR